jgi:hypothetical protein
VASAAGAVAALPAVGLPPGLVAMMGGDPEACGTLHLAVPAEAVASAGSISSCSTKQEEGSSSLQGLPSGGVQAAEAGGCSAASRCPVWPLFSSASPAYHCPLGTMLRQSLQVGCTALGIFSPGQFLHEAQGERTGGR